LGAKYASHAVDYLMGQLEKSTTESGSVVTADPCSVCVLGLIGLSDYTSYLTDMKKRIPNDQWWLHLYPLVRVLSRHVELDFTDEPVRKGPLDSFQTKPVVLPSDINGRRRHWLHPLLTFSAAVIALIVYMKYN
jgi:hypothetical protein